MIDHGYDGFNMALQKKRIKQTKRCKFRSRWPRKPSDELLTSTCSAFERLPPALPTVHYTLPTILTHQQLPTTTPLPLPITHHLWAPRSRNPLYWAHWLWLCTKDMESLDAARRNARRGWIKWKKMSSDLMSWKSKEGTDKNTRKHWRATHELYRHCNHLNMHSALITLNKISIGSLFHTLLAVQSMEAISETIADLRTNVFSRTPMI